MLELIVSDMDGTLIDGNLAITDENRRMIHYTYSLGIPFIVCTGRSFVEAHHILDAAGIRCPVLGLNGAVLFDRTGAVEQEIAIPDQQALPILKFLEQRGVYMEAMTMDNVYSRSKEQRVQVVSHIIEMQSNISHAEAVARARTSAEVNAISYLPELTDLIEKQHQSILKIIVVDPGGPRALRPIKNKLERSFAPLRVTSSFELNIEINASQATKGNAVKAYCQAHGYHLENVMAIGDNLNDVSMLETVGLSYAVKNAAAGAKRAAKYLAPANTDSGVAKAIDHALDITSTVRFADWEQA